MREFHFGDSLFFVNVRITMDDNILLGDDSDIDF